MTSQERKQYLQAQEEHAAKMRLLELQMDIAAEEHDAKLQLIAKQTEEHEANVQRIQKQNEEHEANLRVAAKQQAMFDKQTEMYELKCQLLRAQLQATQGPKISNGPTNSLAGEVGSL